MSASLVCTTGDVIRISDLLLTVSLQGGARWVEQHNAAAVTQPISVSISIFNDVSPAARTDDLSLSLNYFVIAENIRNHTLNKTFSGLRDVSHHISNVLIDTLPVDHHHHHHHGKKLQVHLKVVQLKSPLHTKSVGVELLVELLFRSDVAGGSWVLAPPARIVHFVEDLLCDAIVGVNEQERVEKQDVVVNVVIESGKCGFEGEVVDLRLITKTLYDEITSSGFQTLEALTSFVASKTLSLLPLYDSPPTVLIRIAKPSALVFASRAEVQIRRSLKDFPMSTTIQAKAKFDDMDTCRPHIVAIALGSNLGDTFGNIEHALRCLENPLELSSAHDYGPLAFVHVVDTSFLYESKPMYVENQPEFVNGACIVETNLLPDVLLRLLEAVEVKVGRVPSIRNGPRAVDLDIIFYDDEIIGTRRETPGDFDDEDVEGELIVPHPRLQEREFVLRPLSDMIPDYVHPVLLKSVETLLVDLCGSKDSSMKKVFPFPRAASSSSPDKANETQCCFWSYSSDNNLPHTTQVMATVNATPDSFSDGGVHDTISAALSYISRSIFAGATIVDIGGYSTRPGAAFVSVEDEINRVVPIIRAMRDRKFLESMKHGVEEEVLKRHIDTILTTPISIDTFRWQVAEAAIEAGACCINDVHAFGGPDLWHLSGGEALDEANEYTINMKAVARKYGVAVILMHSRGDAGSNKDYTTFGYAADGKGRGTVLEGVRVELGARVDLVTKGKGGVRRWLVIVDPGIGFSKSMEGNLELLRSAKEVVGYNMIGNPPLSRKKNPLRGFPLLIGTSKKSFLGEILAKQPGGRQTAPEDRKYATAVAVSCAVQQGAMIVRVHDVQEIMDVVKVTKALYF